MARTLTDDNARVEVSEVDLVELLPPDHLAVFGQPDTDARYTIAMIGTGAFQKMRKRYVRQGFNPKTHQREDLPMTDDEGRAFEREVIDAVLVDWAGVTDAAGEPIPCTPDSKIKLPLVVRNALVWVATMGVTKPAQVRADSFRRAAGVGDVVAG